MRKIVTLAAALTLSAAPAFAGEGNGNPFPTQSGAVVMHGPAFTAETGSSAYPTATGNRAQASTLSQLLPTLGNERPILTYFEAGVARSVG